MPLSVTHVFGASDTIVASQVNTNFDDVEAALASLDTTNLADDAGIRATQLADRYAIWSDGVWLVPPINFLTDASAASPARIRRESGGGVDATRGVIIGLAAQEANNTFFDVLSMHFVADTAQEAYIYEVEIRKAFTLANTQFRLAINDVVVGGGAVTLSSATNPAYYRLRNAGPTDAPMAAIVTDDELTFELATPTVGTDTIRGLYVVVRYKARVTN